MFVLVFFKNRNPNDNHDWMVHNMEFMLQLNQLVKKYQGVYAVNDVSLNISKGEFLTLLGPSGSGKTTTLKMVAGLEIPNAGEIWVNGTEITTLPPDKRGLGMVFQNYALFPHMTVEENIAFPLRMARQKPSSEEIKQKVDEILTLVQLEGFQKRYPSQLSGGQQQRIALARALVFSPPIVLMDEPLGALDKKLRSAMQLEIKRIQNKLNITTIYVTHDQEEALTMSDRIAIMNDGRIEQLANPKEIYEHPVNTFVADFIGESNFLPVEVISEAGMGHALRIKSPAASVIPYDSSGKVPGGNDVKLVIRPEKAFLARSGEQAKVSGKIIDVIYLGEMVRYIVLIDDLFEFVVKQQTVSAHEFLRVGEKADISWEDENVRLL